MKNEKMLDVNAGMVLSYARAFQVLGGERYRKVLNDTIAYVEATLRDEKTGGFFGSQDADEEYYRPGDRSGRRPPLVDRTTFADASSLMVSAFIAAWEATGEERHLRTAKAAADHLVRKLHRSRDGIYHSLRSGTLSLPGQLDDNALFGMAMLDLYQATGERRHLDLAAGTGRLIMARFHDQRNRRLGYPLREAVYICAGKRCSKPVKDPAGLRQELEQFIEGLRSAEGR